VRRRIAVVVGGALALWGLTVASVATGLFDRARVETTADAVTTTTATTSTTTTTVATTPAPGPADTTTSVPAATSTTAGPTPPVTMAPASAPPAKLAGGSSDDPIPGRHAISLAAPAGAPPVQGRITIPRLGLDTVTYEGSTLAQIDYGPSHITGTAQPGHVGNTVFAGHRVTKTHPFRDLDKLRPGDTVTFENAEGTYTYEYVYTDVVGELQVEILEQGTGHTATIFACHPPGSDRYRIVTHWRLISPAAKDAPVPDPHGPDPSKAPGFGTGRGGGSGSLGPPSSSSSSPTPTTTVPPSSSAGSTPPPTIGRLPGR
jgi:sortase A